MRDKLEHGLEEIRERLQVCEDYSGCEGVKKYAEALEIAEKAIEQQIALYDMIAEWDIEAERNDTYSAYLTYEIVSQFAIFEVSEVGE